MGVYKSIENGETLRNKTIPCEAIQPLGGDKIKKGYIKGNVAWISGRANRIKYDASIEELRQIVDWMERVTTIPKGSTSKQREAVDADNSVKI